MEIKKRLFMILAVAFVGQVSAASTFQAVQVGTNKPIEFKLLRMGIHRFNITLMNKGQTVAAYGCSIAGSNRLTGNYKDSVVESFTCADLDPQTLLTKGTSSSIELSGSIDGEHEEGVITIENSASQHTKYRYISETKIWE